ncbi:MAG: hypothetical protein ACK5RL_04840 [Acidimicrobiales bacterium]
MAEELRRVGHVAVVARTTMTTPADADHVTPWLDELAAHPRDDDLPVVVAGHSAAVPRLPMAVRHLLDDGWPVVGMICVDGRIPDGRSFAESGPYYAELLDGLVRPDDYVPPWPRWWGSFVTSLVFEPGARREVFDEARPVPRAWFNQGCPVPPLPDEVGRGYLGFGVGYEQSRLRARDAGWVTYRMPGEHLHQVVAPEAVAATLVSFASCICGGEPPKPSEDPPEAPPGGCSAA